MLVDAIVLDVPEEVAIARNAGRPDRDFGPQVIRRQRKDLRRSLGKISRDGFRRVHVLRGSTRSTTPSIVLREGVDRQARADRPVRHHRRRARLPLRAGDAAARPSAGRSTPRARATHPEGRTAVFVGDLVDRGPDSPGRAAPGHGHGRGRHRAVRLGQPRAEAGPRPERPQGQGRPRPARSRWTSSPPSRRSSSGQAHSVHGRPDQPLPARRRQARRRARRAQGGLPRPRLGPGPLLRAVRRHHRARPTSTACRSATPGPSEYRGRAMVVYGHTPVPETEWVNNTICLDTGVRLRRAADRAALPGAGSSSRCPPRRSGTSRSSRSAAPGYRDPGVLYIGDVAGTRHIEIRTARPHQDPGGERRRRTGDHEPVRGRPALAGLPAADDGPAGDLQRSTATWSTRPRRSPSSPRPG